ncbi:MAG: ribulose-phosphate 3-epimerase [Candidatus Aminicenantes bacterium]|nr:MAG: ribulose-phosphate 3-epimerase [Candidatus Aminicenantes bacterium]
MNPNPIFPSILSTNYFNLESRLKLFRSHQIDFIHLDVMDGHFVDNLSFGPSVVTAIKSTFDFRLDSHLMVSNPGKMIPKFIQAGSEWVSFHIEAADDNGVKENIHLIKSQNRKAGIVLNPDSQVERVFPYLKDIDYVLLMSVFPGYGGQKFIPSTVERVSRLKKQITREKCNCLIQVDGGVNISNIESLKSAGTDLFVIGTFLYNSENIPKTIQEIQNKIKGV